MVYDIALLYLLVIKLSDISIIRRLGSGDAGDVYEGRIALYANGKAVALKVVGIPMCASYLHVYLCLLVVLVQGLLLP
jgi:hypothetical protein